MSSYSTVWWFVANGYFSLPESFGDLFQDGVSPDHRSIIIAYKDVVRWISKNLSKLEKL